jgi:hypothetical protein
MKERRQFPRTGLPQKAQFFGANGWEDCTITEASRNGFSVKFYTNEKLFENSIIHLRVVFPSQPYPVEIKGSLKWIEKKGKHFIGGIEWFHIQRGEKNGELLKI